MRIYAVMSSRASDDDILHSFDYPWVLAAFREARDPRGLPYRPGLLLDSGAFSVWSIGRTINLDEYIAWAKEMRESYGGEVRVINLDVIPGEPGRAPSPAEQRRAIRQSVVNAEAIRAAGLPVIEVYHRFEPPKVLEGILERRQPGEVVALGGLVGRSGKGFGVTAPGGRTKERVAFCRSAFAFIRDWAGGWDKLPPVHGLGVTIDGPLGRRYPWFSVDSTTWITARNYNLHVDGRGRFVDRNRETAPRTTKDMEVIFTRRRLALWLRYQESLSALWTGRGVHFADELQAA